MSIESTIADIFREYDTKARSLYPAYAARQIPRLTFYTKGCTGGLAKHLQWEVAINTHVAAQSVEVLRNTVSHEIAHMVDFAMRFRSGHDHIWKAIHRSLGGDGARCVQASGITALRSRVKNEYLYRNAAGAECWVGPKHHAAMMRGTSYGIKNAAGHVFLSTDWTRQRRTLR
jgi:predicted SprT family Zn-dependent metalloprotease